jgi:hypothetical protein
MNEVSKSAKRLLNAYELRIARRFTDRLDLVLDRQGAPKNYTDRLHYLGTHVGVDVSLAEQLLSASYLPTMVQLEQIADKLGIDAGFFIDKTQRPIFRSLRRVPGLNGGDTMHIELPLGFDQTHTCPNQLGWVNGLSLPSSGIQMSDIVVLQIRTATLEDSQVYVLESPRGYSAYSCKFLNNSKALLTGEQKPEGMIFSLCPLGTPSIRDLTDLEIDSISRVLCIIRNIQSRT